MYEITTSKYAKPRKILIDGIEAIVSLPGTRTEMAMSSLQRRLTLLEKRIESGDYVEADLDKVDEYEAAMMDFFHNMFSDATKDNHKIKKWLDETPMSVIQAALEDMKSQFKTNDAESSETTDGQEPA